MAAFAIGLPPLNGAFELGLASGIDAGLSEDDKLPIIRAGSHDDILNYAVTWAYRRTNFSVSAKKVFVAGVRALVSLGWLRTKASGAEQVPDGDWKFVEAPDGAMLALTENERVELKSYCDVLLVKSVASLIVATKVNFWNMNHHTGQGTLDGPAVGYVRKVIGVFFKDSDVNALTKVAHALGHFASTRWLLAMAGVPNIAATFPVTQAADIVSSFTPDVKIRFASLPAGTHRLAVAFAGARKMLLNSVASFCPNVSDFRHLPAEYQRVLADRTKFHIGAEYLTGAPRANFDDSVYGGYLGRVGAFVANMIPNTTIGKSPHLDKDKIGSYDDYSADWYEFVRTRKQDATLNPADARLVMAGGEEAAIDEVRLLYRGVEPGAANNQGN